MKIKEIAVRLGYTLLGSLLTLCIVLIHDEYVAASSAENEELVLVEEYASEESEELALPETEEVETMMHDYEAEAKEKYAQQLVDEEKKKQLEKEEQEKLALEDTKGEEEEITVSANSIEAAPVKWKKDYPMVNSFKPLAEKELERSSYEETLAVNAFDKEVIKNSTIDFSDVKITIMGDSLTEGSNLDPWDRETYSYPAVLQDILGCKEIVNLGIGGSTVSEVGDNAMAERRYDIPMDSDIIIIFGGTNDCLFQNKWEFGEIEKEYREKSDPTFCEDLDRLVSKTQHRAEENEENYSKLIYINPPSTILNDAVYAIDPGNMVHQSKFAEAINIIAPEYGFEVIDFYNNNILNTHDKDVQEQFMPDGVHGNKEGYRIMAEHIASQIIQRIEQ